MLAQYTFLIVVLATGCASTPGPCLDWVQPGQAYQVTLGKPELIPGIGLEARSCGVTFDLHEGDSFVLATAEQKPASPSCDLIKATTPSTIPNVGLGEPGYVATAWIRPDVEAAFPNATVGGACRVAYRLGLYGADVVRAYRNVDTSTVDECADEGAGVSKEAPWCWDSWRVEVKDSQGKVVATSLE